MLNIGRSVLRSWKSKSAKAEDFLNDQKNLSINALPGGQKPRRWALTQSRNDSEDLKKTLATAKDEYARARQEEVNLAKGAKAN